MKMKAIIAGGGTGGHIFPAIAVAARHLREEVRGVGPRGDAVGRAHVLGLDAAEDVGQHVLRRLERECQRAHLRGHWPRD